MGLLNNNKIFDVARSHPKLENSFVQDAKGDWLFIERIHAGYGQAIDISDFYLCVDTKYQNLVVFESKLFGNVMLLDGAVQITENNWRPYQEGLAVGAILPKNINPEMTYEVLVIGGGDGGVATVALELFPNVRVTMVEIDEDVVKASQTFLPNISKSLTDPCERFKLHIQDGVAYVRNPENHNKYHAVIVDCTDPAGPAEGLFGEDFHQNLKKCLVKDGIVLQQSGTLDFQFSEVAECIQMMKRHYKYPVIFPVDMATYPGTMTLVGGCDVDLASEDRETLKLRYVSLHNLVKMTEYVGPYWLSNSINHLPPIYQRKLSGLLNRDNKQTVSFAGTTHVLLPPPSSKGGSFLGDADTGCQPGYERR
jgi:spermidine synthase